MHIPAEWWDGRVDSTAIFLHESHAGRWPAEGKYRPEIAACPDPCLKIGFHSIAER